MLHNHVWLVAKFWRAQASLCILWDLWEPAAPKPVPGIWWVLGKVCWVEGKSKCSPGAVNMPAGVHAQHSQELGYIPRKRSALQAGSLAAVPGRWLPRSGSPTCSLGEQTGAGDATAGGR